MPAARGYSLLIIFMVLVAGFAPVSDARPRNTIDEVLTKAWLDLLSRLWAFSDATISAISGRLAMKFEGGYSVETVFDGSMLGIEPFAIEASPSGDLLVLDSANSNIHKISLPLSGHSRPELVAGSSEGYAGHVDGKLRDARLNHPLGFAVDDRGNIYVADTMNKAIRKISDKGVTTIAGGKWNRGGEHIDGRSDRAKFSNDFDIVYMGGSCSLLVVDRGNKAIREIQLHPDDCSHQYETDLPLGILCLVAACFCGYMLGFLFHKVKGRPHLNENWKLKKANVQSSPLRMQKSSPMPPLVPTVDEVQEQGLLSSLGDLLYNTGASFVAITGGLFFNREKNPYDSNFSHPYQRDGSSWPTRESFEILDADRPSETDNLTFHKSYMPTDSKFRHRRHHHTKKDDELQQREPVSPPARSTHLL